MAIRKPGQPKNIMSGSEQFDQRIFDFSFSNYKEIDYNKHRAEQAYSHLQQSICCQESFLISTSYQL